MNDRYISPTDARLLKSLQGSMGEEQLNKALGADANELLKGGKDGLVPKKVQVTKNGKTFEQTVYVSPDQSKQSHKFEVGAMYKYGNGKYTMHDIDSDNNTVRLVSESGHGAEIPVHKFLESQNKQIGNTKVPAPDKKHVIGTGDKTEQYKYHPTDRKPKYRNADDVKNGMNEINRKDFGGNHVFGHPGGSKGYLNLPKLATATGKTVSTEDGKINEEGMKLLKEMLTRQFGSDGKVNIYSQGHGSVYFDLDHDALVSGAKKSTNKSSSEKALDIEKDDITIVMTDSNHSVSDVKKFMADNGKSVFPNGHQKVTVKDLDSEVGGTTTMYIPADVKDVDGFKKRFEKLMTEYLESGDEDKMQNFKIKDAED